MGDRDRWPDSSSKNLGIGSAHAMAAHGAYLSWRQYFCQAASMVIGDLKIIVTILYFLGEASGLRVNLFKSGFLLIFIPENLILTIANSFRLDRLTMPIYYLDLSLFTKKLPKTALSPYYPTLFGGSIKT
jgi:hypothetical protein